ncbi:MAG: 4-alpha-glucanotransferase [Janthinobacterium sp.]|jgi:4-alpha-glucanotransferase
MSADGFHVHGPHDHAVEHVAHSTDQFSSRIAVMTAIMATVGAMFGYQGGATQNDAALAKNNAAIEKTEAANRWNYYQAKSNKQNLAEMAMTLPGANTEKYKADVARYQREKDDIKKDAEKWEASSRQWNDKSDQAMHQHHQWALATTAEQIAISLAAITLLTRKKWLQYAAYGMAGIGLALGVLAWLHLDPIAAVMVALGGATAVH